MLVNEKNIITRLNNFKLYLANIETNFVSYLRLQLFLI